MKKKNVENRSQVEFVKNTNLFIRNPLAHPLRFNRFHRRFRKSIFSTVKKQVTYYDEKQKFGRLRRKS